VTAGVIEIDVAKLAPVQNFLLVLSYNAASVPITLSDENGKPLEMAKHYKIITSSC